MAEDLKKARDIYWAHACNHFHIDREGMGEKYKELGGASEHEAEWRKEYIRRNVDLAKGTIEEGMRWLAHAYAHEALPEVIKFENYGDDYEKFWYAFYLKDLADCAETSAELRQVAYTKSVNLWNEILSMPRKLTPENSAKISTKIALKAFGASTTEDYLSRYSRKKLEEAGQIAKKPDSLWRKIKKGLLFSRFVRSLRG